MSNPYWYNLLDHFERKRYYQNGLTIPFIIGAKSIIKSEEPMITISELVNDMAQSSGKRVTVLRCGQIREYVFGLLDNETAALLKMYPEIYKQIGKLVVTDRSFIDCKSTADIIERLEQEYQAKVDEGRFSKENGVWGDCSKVDLERIKEVKDQ